jgi:hypothetical protein
MTTGNSVVFLATCDVTQYGSCLGLSATRDSNAISPDTQGVNAGAYVLSTKDAVQLNITVYCPNDEVPQIECVTVTCQPHQPQPQNGPGWGVYPTPFFNKTNGTNPDVFGSYTWPNDIYPPVKPTNGAYTFLPKTGWNPLIPTVSGIWSFAIQLTLSFTIDGGPPSYRVFRHEPEVQVGDGSR